MYMRVYDGRYFRHRRDTLAMDVSPLLGAELISC